MPTPATSMLVEHQLDWAAMRTPDEGRFLCTVLNSPAPSQSVRTPFMTSGKGGDRHIGKSLGISPFRSSMQQTRAHGTRRIARDVERLIAKLDFPKAPHGTLRRIARTALNDAGISGKSDRLVIEILQGDHSVCGGGSTVIPCSSPRTAARRSAFEPPADRVRLQRAGERGGGWQNPSSDQLDEQERTGTTAAAGGHP